MAKRFVAFLTVLVAILTPIHCFLQPISRIPAVGSSYPAIFLPSKLIPSTPAFSQQSSPRTHSVACYGFNLPPGKSKDNGLQEILMGAASIGGLILFFASPLGGLFFAAVNSVLALALLTPLFLILAFNVWQFVNTTTGNCPSCNAPVRVLKDGSPSICLNCGSLLKGRSSKDGRIDFAPNVDQFQQDDSSLFGGLFARDSFASPTMQQQQTQERREKQYRRERTVIDVDVEDVDKK